MYEFQLILDKEKKLYSSLIFVQILVDIKT